MVEIKFLEELKDRLNEKDLGSENCTGGYTYLHHFCQAFIVPELIKQGATISVVELTTCGLLTDVLTGLSGASKYFLLGITPYNSDMKIKLGIPPELLSHEGSGTVSTPTAIALAQRVRIHSNSTIGLAETGMLPSEFKKRRTQKKAGEVHLAIDTETVFMNKKLIIQQDLSRVLMRQAIAFEVLKTLETFLCSDNLPKSEGL
ncbi:MAG: CinA family protein [Candidatus Hodarchaeales archaeon]|jgi:nicotinamide-nucleotide amidase